MSHGVSPNDLLYSTDSKPYGLSFGDWTARWWQWLLEQPVANNPAFKEEYSSNNQIVSNVWFLPGTFGGSVRRRCTVPAGRAVLVPVINYECSFADEPDLKTESALIDRAGSEIDDITAMRAYLDGAELAELNKYRVRSPIFDVTLPNDNVFNGKPGQTKAVSEGYWLFFSPLPPGKHSLYTFGSCLNGKIKLEVDFDLLVAANSEEYSR
jgi:hypothetical protein